MMFIKRLLHHLPIHHLSEPHRDWVRIVAPGFLLTLFVSLLILFLGPHLSIAGATPLADLDKRILSVVCLFLIWLIKFLLRDVSHPLLSAHLPKDSRLVCQQIEARFNSAWQFLRSTKVRFRDGSRPLSALPWWILIGPLGAGKTSLLEHADIPYVLHKKTVRMNASDKDSYFDCWATREALVIEASGDTLGFRSIDTRKKPLRSKIDNLWSYFLYVVKRKHAISGIVLTLSCMELLRYNERDSRLAIRRLQERFDALSRVSKQPLPLYIVLTQCDKLPGFVPYFQLLSQEERHQLFGFECKIGNKSLYDGCLHQFDHLIQQINMQLVTKLHQTHALDAKVLLKQFPLSLERVKRSVLFFVKRLQGEWRGLSGVYLTSAMQPQEKTKTVLNDAPLSNDRTLSKHVIKPFVSQSYFIRDLFNLLKQPPNQAANVHPVFAWFKRYKNSLIMCSAFVLTALFMFIKDCAVALTIHRELQASHAAYERSSITVDPLAKITRTVQWLNTLEHLASDQSSLFWLHFYTDRAKQTAKRAYQRILIERLLPEIKNEFEDHLTVLTNYEPSDVYAFLQAYLMLNGDIPLVPSSVLQAMQQAGLPRKIALLHHMQNALSLNELPSGINQSVVDGVRRYLWQLPREKRALVVLLHQERNAEPLPLPNLFTDERPFVHDKNLTIPRMYSSAAMGRVVIEGVQAAVIEALSGNVVLGMQPSVALNEKEVEWVATIVRQSYWQAYATKWENFLKKIELAPMSSLVAWDHTVSAFIQVSQEFDALFAFVHENTYFEPILSMSNTLKAFGEMRAKRQDQPLLLEVRRTLTSLHQYMKPVVTTRHPEKIAFELSSKRMQHQNSQDPISVLHQVAYQSPLPLKSWLDQIADSAWHLLMKEAGHYVDVAWREQVAPYYAEYLEKRYPFTAQSKEDVDLDHFTQFFGRSGHLHVFYQNYLDPFLDYEEKEWRFKKRDGEAIPLTQVALKQIQEALRVHEAFFPNGNDDMRVTFGIRPYAFGDKIKQVNLRVNGDEWQNTLSKQNTHWVEWPERHGRGSASYTYLLKDNKMQSGRYPGTWGLFRLVEKTYDAMLSKQEVLVELSTEGDSAKYVISTKDPINPLIYSKMGYMRLPSSLLA